MMGIMPRRDVVLTGLIAFGAGVAVGANWKKLRRKLGPLLEKCGLQMADLGDFLSAASEEDFPFDTEATAAKPAGRRPRRKKVETEETIFAAPKTRRNRKSVPFPTVTPVKRKRATRKPIVAADSEIPAATGTYGS